MSSFVGRFWLIEEGRLRELPRSEWPVDVTKDPWCFRIRWGVLSSGELGMNIRTRNGLRIYRVINGHVVKIAGA